jgi:hypothetical protein
MIHTNDGLNHLYEYVKDFFNFMDGRTTKWGRGLPHSGSSNRRRMSGAFGSRDPSWLISAMPRAPSQGPGPLLSPTFCCGAVIIRLAKRIGKKIRLVVSPVGYRYNPPKMDM